MDSVADEFGQLFNSPLEAGIRAVVILEKLRPEAMDLAEMVLFDHVVVHTADLGGPPSLHPDLPGRKGELLVRRRLVEKSLDLMRRCHLVEQEITDDGVWYRASDEAANYVELLESSYSERLKRCAEWIAAQVRLKDKAAFKSLVRDRIGEWTDAFSTVGGTLQGRA
jgi:ABC-3C biological conflict system middle component